MDYFVSTSCGILLKKSFLWNFLCGDFREIIIREVKGQVDLSFNPPWGAKSHKDKASLNIKEWITSLSPEWGSSMSSRSHISGELDRWNFSRWFTLISRILCLCFSSKLVGRTHTSLWVYFAILLLFLLASRYSLGIFITGLRGIPEWMVKDVGESEPSSLSSKISFIFGLQHFHFFPWSWVTFHICFFTILEGYSRGCNKWFSWNFFGRPGFSLGGNDDHRLEHVHHKVSGMSLWAPHDAINSGVFLLAANRVDEAKSDLC